MVLPLRTNFQPNRTLMYPEPGQASHVSHPERKQEILEESTGIAAGMNPDSSFVKCWHFGGKEPVKCKSGEVKDGRKSLE